MMQPKLVLFLLKYQFQFFSILKCCLAIKHLLTQLSTKKTTQSKFGFSCPLTVEYEFTALCRTLTIKPTHRASVDISGRGKQETQETNERNKNERVTKQETEHD